MSFDAAQCVLDGFYIVGDKQNGRKLVVDGESGPIDEKSYDLGYSAAVAGQDFDSTFDEGPRNWLCDISWIAGYTEGVASIAIRVESFQRLSRVNRDMCKTLGLPVQEPKPFNISGFPVLL